MRIPLSGVYLLRLLRLLAHNRWDRAGLLVLTQMMFEDDKKGWECNASGPFLNDNKKKLRLSVILVYFEYMEAYRLKWPKRAFNCYRIFRLRSMPW